ncbi:hypothetical protein FHG87_000218 [Trinorchestia longiramus]|nr:hypothetical protein FHG87_000218 [Trinorchestia longiramus]
MKISEMKWLLVTKLELTVLVLCCYASNLYQDRARDKNSCSTNIEKQVQFEEEECERPRDDMGTMDNETVIICFSPCGAHNITFNAKYEEGGNVRYVRLYVPIISENGDCPVSASLQFSYNERHIFLTLSSIKFGNLTQTEAKKDGNTTFHGWSVKAENKNLPFRNINNSEQCDSTSRTVLDMDVTTSIASTDGIPSAEGKLGLLAEVFAENKTAFIAGGVLGFILIIVLIATAAHCVCKKCPNSKQEAVNGKGETRDARPAGGIARHCSINSLYDSSSFSKPLQRHESINSLYRNHDNSAAEHKSTAKLDQHLKPVTHDHSNGVLRNVLPGTTMNYESKNSLYYNPSEDAVKSIYADSNIYDPV